MGTKKTYVVKYRYYHYNTGSANNGTLKEEREFETFEGALKCAKEIREWAGAMSCPDDIEDEYCDFGSGYLTSYDGIFIRHVIETEIKL